MANRRSITEYLERQQSSFDEVPFNDVDSLILCTIGYCNLEEGLLSSSSPADKVPLPMALCGVPVKKLFGESWLKEFDGRAWFTALLQSPRFALVRMGYYTNQISEKIEKQFSAVTFYLPDNQVYIAYRGTDNSFAGWKEDFNLSFMDVVPSQISAKHYLAGVASATNGPIMVGGHSKGGNIAEFAALTADDAAYERLTVCYNHDGPSFLNDPSPRINTDEFKAKLHKTVPESSVFGMLMEKRGNYRIIQADNMAFFQHAPLNWIVEGNDFVSVQNLTADASLFDETMNTWMLGYTPEQRGQFVDTIYTMLKTTNVKTWAEFDQKHSENIAKLLGESTKLDPEMRNMVMTMLTEIAKFYGSEAFKYMHDKAPIVLPDNLPVPKIELPKMPQLPFMKPLEGEKGTGGNK